MNLLLGADFVYGNARLRARKADLLRASDYEHLLGKDVDALLGTLSETPYARDVEAALVREHGIRSLNAAVRNHLARSLEEMRGFYTGPARELVDLLLSRFDLANLVALLRATLGDTDSPEDALSALNAVGWPGEALADEILRQHEPAAAVGLITRWLPDGAQGRALRSAFTAYERTDDFSVFEQAVIAKHREHVVAAAEKHGRHGASLLEFVRREIDEQNMLLGLRLRAALEQGEITTLSLDGNAPSGGAIPVAALEAAVRLPSRAAVATELVALGRESWREPLSDWTASGDVVRLAQAVERAWAADAVRLFVSGDPLGIDVPLAFSVAKQTEARNLRLLAEATLRHRDAQSVRSDLVLLESM